MRGRGSWPVTVCAVLLLGAACADAPISPFEGLWIPAEGIPTHVELTCGRDGSFGVSSETVQAQPDGVHLTVVNGSAEPVSVGGFDADPGISRWTLAAAPGTLDLTCWPFSQHGSGQKPVGAAAEVLDPFGMYVGGDLSCEMSAAAAVDFAEAPVDDGPPPLDVARKTIEGLRADDVLRLAGYPEQEHASVLVIRESEVIASIGFVRFRDRPWSVAGSTVCADAGLDLYGDGR